MVLGVFSSMRKNIKRGQIWFVDLPEAVGSEQKGKRPALVVSADINGNSTVYTVLVGTRKEKKEDQQSQFTITTDYGLDSDTVFMAEQMKSLDEQRFLFYITRVDDFKMREADQAMAIHLGIFAFFNIEYVKLLIEQINKIDADSLQYPIDENKKLDVMNELDIYCTKYGYNSRVFLDKYLLFKGEVELSGRVCG
jgi:mRNA interferase MazF